MEGTIGEIRMFAGSFPPKNWAFCNGQIIAIASNTALFSILGTVYGGNGQTTFALPDLQGRLPVGAGAAPGGSNYYLGQAAGNETVTLTQSQMPIHSHIVTGSIRVGAVADNTSPTGTYLATPTNLDIYAENPGSGTLGVNAITGQTGADGSSMPIPVLQPYLGMNYIICMYGVFPYRG